MEQKRRQVAWRDERPRRQKKRVARRRRIMIAYMVRGIVAVILAVMVLLMICGCLYIKDFFRGDKDTDRKAESDKGTVSHVEEETETIGEIKEDTRYKIMLDAGHGGTDGGTEKQAAVEKDINLAIVLEMKELLENKSIRVALTRDRDVFMSLEDRVRAAEEAGADLFLSVHCNYYEKDSSISGLECYYCKGASEGRDYAEKIITEIEERGNIVSRNAKPADYYVLKNTSIPAVLVEVGYLSNYNERTNLMTEEYQERIAIELVEGVVKGFESKSNHLSV
ncbi:N-acetylmuramoyl-L-alanine amidase family protein [Enterocloster clostridioformis]|uniref:N-acetylmuramoyl-L-alanine amidase n=1 Tax=Enterocloster clostridioformis TaxID=1531 RepID=A0A2X2W8Y8_9FIRM|nr:N-acetylmuramoyl-L-alanine amidase [Enterocloster clostridioformis]MCA5577291.1 N-acetylmuramoyl-L-alanine amidase [Enterocloster clostridioformis]SQB10139.1 N-acetylmuramoyl-L-alanine amidase [Enterocloster clostridioformis]